MKKAMHDRALGIARSKGQRAGLDGTPAELNPYWKADFRDAWEEGWKKGRDEARLHQDMIEDQPRGGLGHLKD